MRNWNKFIDRQKYSECQLITALNAYYYLTGKIYCEQNSKEYEELVDLCCARVGAAINIGKIHKKLNLIILEKHRNLLDFFDGKKLPLPIEANVWHRLTGFHSVLIVDHISRCDVVRITNFPYETRNGWLFLSDLGLYVSHVFSGDNGLNSEGKKWNFRLFGLK